MLQMGSFTYYCGNSLTNRVIPRNRWLRLNMTEKLFTGTLNHNQNKTKQKLTNSNGCKVIARHSFVFISIRDHSGSFANIRNMFLKFERKAYSQHILKQSQVILIDGNAFVVILKILVKIR